MTRTPPHHPHTLSRRGLAVPAALGLLLGGVGLGCNGGTVDSDSDTDTSTGACAADIASGALVITEVMADPEGADDGREWFEVYNASGDTVNLKGAVLAYSKTNGDSPKAHTISVDLEIAPGQYMTFGDVLPEAAPAHIDYGYANDLGSMGNTAGRLQVVCGDTLVDQVLYTDVKQRFTRSFTGKLDPDSVANDDQNNWCLAPEVYDPITDEHGSPRAANPDCPPPPPPEGQCWDGDMIRDIVAPRPGDLVINEFHANPMVVDDADGEWIELMALAAVDLNGLSLGKEPIDVLQTLDAADFPECLRVEAGDYVVFARELDMGVNGGIPQVDHALDFSLNNSNSGIFLANSDGEVIDAITYASTTDGAASSLDPAFATADANDDPNGWCPAEAAYGEGDLGTPGAANPSCPQPPPEDQCDDNGEWRDIAFPAVGDLVITEVMANPEAVADADGEWLEIYVGADIDLNRLVLGKEPGAVLQTLGADDATCMPVAAGTYILLAANGDMATNGGLPEPTYPLDFSLGNSGGPLFVALPGADDMTPGEVLDDTTYAASAAGHSRALDPSQLNPLGNDDPMNWCDAADADVYGAGDFGTPAAANSSCGVVNPGLCDDNGDMREPVKPAMGDLTFTEYMANPNAVSDGNGEWFEVQVNGTFDLNNLQLGKQPGNVEQTLVATECLSVAPGDILVFAHSDDPLVNGGLPQVDHLFGFSLVNSNGGLFAAIDDMVIAEIDYASSFTGAATSLDPNGVDWCAAVDPYGDGDLGTPGAVNPECGMMMMGDQCLENGNPRDIVFAGPGDLVITEFMANPAAVADSAGEWFEIAAVNPVDLNGLKHAKLAADLGGAAPLVSNDCVALAAGDHVLFAKNTDPNLNGGLPEVDFEMNISLNNSSSGIAIGVADVVVDEVLYVASQAAGKSVSLDPGSYNADLNDDADMAPWCAGVDPYGDGDLGTPKAVNPACG
ncbi:MAG: lamin tail domain-containing protein [Myxococcales bacterium]|nr:lamin tail domain-containing protein [Myxococcales bacterium]